MFFRPNLENKPATKAQLAILTDFQRKVREIAEEAGRQRGRPMLVATRVPLTVSTCNHVGIGIERWLKDGLVDVLTTGGGYVPFGMPTKQLVKLGHKYDVPVYPCISGSGMRGGADYNSIEAWRGAASSAWAQGADGIYIFNYFPTETTPHLMELGDPKKLATMDKLFPIDNNVYRAGAHSQAIPWDDVIPVEVTGTKPVKLNLSIGDDIAAAAKSGRLREAKLMIQYEPPVTSGSLIASLNGHVLSQSESTVEGGRVTYKTDPGWYVKGRNSIIFKLPRGAETKRNIAVDEMGVSIKTSSTNVVLKPIGAPYQMSGSSTLMGMPAWVEIEWPVAHNIGEIVIYGGVPECADNPSTECTPLDYRLQYMKAGSWADIIPPVLNAPRYRDYRAPGKPSWNFKYSHEFSPISAKAVRLYVERSSDSGLRVTQAPMLPEEKRVTDIRGIKVFEARSGGKSASKTGSTAHTVCSVELRVSYKQ